MELLDGVFKQVRQSEEPYGGVQLVVAGDFMQVKLGDACTLTHTHTHSLACDAH